MNPPTQDPDCIFCRILAGQAPGEIIYRDEQVTAFYDIHPVAPVHVLVVPNRHIASLNEIHPEDGAVLGRMLSLARELAAREGVQHSGYRLVVNTGPDAGQIVYHLHLHLMGGRRMPPKMAFG